MSDHDKGGLFKHLAPHWAAVSVAALSLIIGAIWAVRAEDLNSINSKIDANTQRINALVTQMSNLATQEAVLVQKETDLLDLMNRYVQRKGGL